MPFVRLWNWRDIGIAEYLLHFPFLLLYFWFLLLLNSYWWLCSVFLNWTKTEDILFWLNCKFWRITQTYTHTYRNGFRELDIYNLFGVNLTEYLHKNFIYCCEENCFLFCYLGTRTNFCRFSYIIYHPEGNPRFEKRNLLAEILQDTEKCIRPLFSYTSTFTSNSRKRISSFEH